MHAHDADWLQRKADELRLIAHRYLEEAERIQRIAEGVMPSESDTPAPSLPGPPLAATDPQAIWDAWVRRRDLRAARGQ